MATTYANIYTKFRKAINDNTAPYKVDDTLVLSYLDQGLSHASDILKYTFKETHVLTQAEIDQGYFSLNHEIVGIIGDWFNGNSLVWEYGGGKKIRLIDTSAFTAGTSYTIFYKAHFKKFSGVALEQSSVDLPEDAELGVVLIALGYYSKAGAVINGSGTPGTISSKSEEGLSVSYNNGDINSPESFIDTGVDILRNLPMAESTVFSVHV